jgi:hypothetical protein
VRYTRAHGILIMYVAGKQQREFINIFFIFWDFSDFLLWFEWIFADTYRGGRYFAKRGTSETGFSDIVVIFDDFSVILNAIVYEWQTPTRCRRSTLN